MVNHNFLHIPFKRVNKMRLLLVVLLTFLNVKGLSASQSVVMNPDKRLKAVISCDSMNRLAVANDRITQIFGDNNAYDVQTEEATGQLFLKPTVENGKKPLSITLITESGLTQDMTLQPEEREATTVILKNINGASTSLAGETIIDATGGLGAFPSSRPRLQQTAQGSITLQNSHDNFAAGMQMPNFGSALSLQEQVIQAMKYLISGSAPLIEVEGVSRNGPQKWPQTVSVDLVGAFNLGNFKGLKLEVKNVTDIAIDIVEKDFLQNYDLALAFEKRVLKPSETTLLYVVVRA